MRTLESAYNAGVEAADKAHEQEIKDLWYIISVKNETISQQEENIERIRSLLKRIAEC